MKFIRLLCVLIGATTLLLITLRQPGVVRSQSTPPPYPPHLGYGINVRHNLDLAAPLGFDWIKVYQDQLADLPSGQLPYHVLLRITVAGYPADLNAYLQSVSDLISANQDRLDAIEIGNEPNADWSWGGQDPNPEQYARLVCQLRPVIKSISPKLIIVSAGLSPVGRTRPSQWVDAMDDRVFAQRMIDTMRNEFPGQYPCFDAFGYHAQGFPYEPERATEDLPPSDNGNEFHFRATEWYRNWMVANDIGDHQIWLTEFGWLRDPAFDAWYGNPSFGTTYGWCNLSTGTDYDQYKWMRITEQQQADYLVRAFQYADANWPWLGPMFVWNLDWNNQGWDSDGIKFFSILHAISRNDGEPHAHDPALAYSALISMTKRYVVNNPTLAVQPTAFTFLTEVATPTIQTQTLSIANTTASSIMTWSIAISNAIVITPIVAPITGTNNATVTVQIDTSPITSTGIYSANLIVTAQPTTTSGSPITIPIHVIVVEPLQQIFLPVIARDYGTLLPPPVAPPLGLAYISSAKYGGSETRYQRALAIDGRLNRWPMYWNEIETQAVTQPRIFDWSKQDTNIAADINHGLTVLPILMFTPTGLDTSGSRLAPIPQVGDGLRALLDDATLDRPVTPSSVTSPPQGLYEPIFADNSDIPGPGKSINPDNRWAYFVTAAVNRYKPGGVLAQQQGWNDDRGVRYWEIWNEPDLDVFFTGTITDYARLLKVSYLSARAADPQAQIVLGGMVHWQKPGWFSALLNSIRTDPVAAEHHYFMDKVAVHNYFWAWQTFGYLYPDRVQLDAHGLNDVELWLTETGVPVCGEGTFPACDDPQNRWYRAAPDEQAAYLIQSATYAAWLKTEAYIWFQLFDDCGNQCGVDAYGLLRNDNTPRLSYQTYPLVFDQLTNVQPYWRDRRTITATNWISGNQEIMAFKRPATGERIVVMWTRYYTNATVVLTATAPSAQLFFPDGSMQTIVPISGTYAISLPLASNRNFIGTIGGVAPDSTGSAPIGGSPRILVEIDPAVTP